MAWSNNLFYIAFLSQIFLMSYYLPNKLLARMRYILATYPPEMYPKLYAWPTERYKMAHLAFLVITRLVVLLGLLILVALMFWVDHGTFADHGFISVFWPAAYGVIQFLPLMAVEFSELSHFKQMRKANSSTTRTAELRRRDFTQLVSPRLVGMAISLFVGAIIFDFYAHDFAAGWGHDTIQRALVMSVTNGMLAIVGAWTLYGRKLDPHESTATRSRRISVSLKSLLYVSMALSVFIATTAADDLYNLDFIDALIMSIYFQGIALLSLGYTLNNLKLDEIDFNVYRKDVAAT